MDIRERETPWIKRIEELIEALDGSTIGELELYEAGAEIIIRRRPDMVLVSSSPVVPANAPQPVATGGAKGPAPREDRGQPVVVPLTGVYYSSPSPSSPPFVNIGEIIHVGQVVALVEAMKVFNEIQSEVAGRVLALKFENGDVVHKGDVLMKVDPL